MAYTLNITTFDRSKVYVKHFFQFFIYIFLFFSLFLFVSCKRESVELNRAKTKNLLKICDNIQKQNQKEALSIIAETPSLKHSKLALYLESQQQNKELYEKFNKFLLEQQFSRAIEMIQEAESSGLATSELIQLKKLPYALQALELFCVRMPWEDVESLQKNWQYLQKHDAILEKSAVYCVFRDQQLEHLKQLQQKDSLAIQTILLFRLDQLCAGGENEKALQLFQHFSNQYPMHPLSLLIRGKNFTTQYFNILESKKLLSEQYSSFELATALNSTSLTSKQKNAVLDIFIKIPQRSTISGTLLNYSFLNTHTNLSSILLAWQKTAQKELGFPNFFHTALKEKYSSVLSSTESLAGIPYILTILDQISK